MEKIHDAIFRKSIILGMITFLCALILVIFLKICLGLKNITLEQTIVPMAMTFSFLYGYKLKEQMSKTYKLKYSLSTTVPYLLVATFIHFYSREISHLKHFDLLFTGVLIQFLIMTFVIYFLSGFTSEKSSNQDYHKRLIAQKNAPIELQKKRNLVGWLLVLFMAFPLLFIYLKDNQIVNFSSISILILGITFFLGLYLIIKYLKDTKIN